MAKIVTYDPTEVILTIDQFQVEGWNRITVKKNAPSFTLIQGIRGQNTRRRNRDTSFTITVEVIQSSITNAVFSEVVRQDIAYGNGRLEVKLADTNGTTRFHSLTGFIKDYADMAYGAEMGTRTWEIICSSAAATIGSGENNQSALSDIPTSNGMIPDIGGGMLA